MGWAPEPDAGMFNENHSTASDNYNKGGDTSFTCQGVGLRKVAWLFLTGWHASKSLGFALGIRTVKRRFINA